MGKARHDRIGIFFSAREQRPLQPDQARLNGVHGIAHPNTEIRRDLIIARPAGPKPATDICPDPVDESAFQCAVHILVSDDGCKTTVGDIRTQAVQPGQQRVTLFIGQKAGFMQHLRVRLRGDDVIGCQHPVEVGGATQRYQFRCLAVCPL
jgi:hypothetical protein